MWKSSFACHRRLLGAVAKALAAVMAALAHEAAWKLQGVSKKHPRGFKVEKLFAGSWEFLFWRLVGALEAFGEGLSLEARGGS